MVTKGKKAGAKKRRVKVGKLQLRRETVKDLSAGEQKRVAGGAKRRASARSCLVDMYTNCIG